MGDVNERKNEKVKERKRKDMRKREVEGNVEGEK